MTRSLWIIIIVFAVITAAQAGAEPQVDRDAQVRRYIATMDSCLQQIGIEIKRVDMRCNEVFVAYEVAEDGPAPRYALAAVLMLMRPVAQDAALVRARDATHGRRLLTLSVKPEQLAAVPGWIVDVDECAEIEALLHEAETACEAASD